MFTLQVILGPNDDSRELKQTFKIHIQHVHLYLIGVAKFGGQFKTKYMQTSGNSRAVYSKEHYWYSQCYDDPKIYLGTFFSTY